MGPAVADWRLAPLIPAEPKASAAKAHAAEEADDGSDPHAVLGIAAGASADEAKARYERLRAEYHPDRYAKVGLPPDVLDYVVQKSKRIDAAYATISSQSAGEQPVPQAAAGQ